MGKDTRNRILIVLPCLCNNGLNSIVRRILEERKEYRFSVAAEVTPTAPELPEDVTIHPLPPQEDVIRYFGGIRRTVRKGSYDGVYIHANSALMFVEALAARMGGCRRIIAHCHSSSSLRKPIHYLVKPFFNLLTDTKIGCSKVASRWVYIGSGIHTIPNGIDEEKYRFDPGIREEVREELAVGSDETLVGAFGRLAPEKNPEFLMEIFAGIAGMDPSAMLLLVCDENEEKEACALGEAPGVSDRIIFLRPTKDIHRYYHALDVMLMPSLFEGLSLIALESQANGLPLVLSDHLTEETYATDYAVPVSLKEPAETWGKRAIEAIGKLPRGEAQTTIFTERGLTEKQMLEEIGQVLASALGEAPSGCRNRERRL